jgi:hypothetical protein
VLVQEEQPVEHASGVTDDARQAAVSYDESILSVLTTLAMGTAPLTGAGASEKSPLQPTRRVEAVRAGSVMVAAEASASAPSRKAESV